MSASLALTASVVGASSPSTTSVTLGSVADTYANDQQPTTPQGTKPYAFGTTSVNQAFVKFSTAGKAPKGQVLVSASLRVYTAVNLAKTAGVQVHPVASSWSESSLTAKSRPAFQTAVLNKPVSTPVGKYTDIPLTSLTAVNLAGDTSFELRYAVANSSFQFDTRESKFAPQLVLTFAPAPSIDPATLTATADTYANDQQPTTPQGSKPYAFGTTSVNQAFVKFATGGSAPAGSVVTSATLRIYTMFDGVSTPGLQVHPASSAWSESSLTSANRPAFQTVVLNDPIATPVGKYTDIPLKSLDSISLTGDTSFELRYSVGNSSYQFSTRESKNPPQLLLTFAGAGSTAPTPPPVTTPAPPVTTPPAPPVTTPPAPPVTTPPAPPTTPPAPPVTTPAPTPPTTTPTPPTNTGSLPFALPTKTNGKLVFAHYFTPYPISLDNKPGSSDYYAMNYLNPNGESGSHKAYGGMLRDRPQMRSPLSGDWALADMETDVRDAKAAGLDGFTVDILSTSGYNLDRDYLLMKAANIVDPNFKIFIMPDMNGGLGTMSQSAFVDEIAGLAKQPSAYHLSDGRLMLSPFKAEAKSADWWTQTFAMLKSKYGITVAFVPTFVNWRDSYKSYVPISYGMSDWGTRTVTSSARTAQNGIDAHNLGLKWMQAVAVQDERPDQGIYQEADNLDQLTTNWEGAIDGNADWVQLPTWNDYSEGTSFQPSEGHGWTFLDYSDYYLTKFKTGSFPTITKDALYLTHRSQMAAAKPSFAETNLMRLRGDSPAARDAVEVNSFLVAPATVTFHVGSQTYTWDAPAGASSHTVPLGYGSISASASRDGKVISTVKSNKTVVANPVTQDLAYYGYASLRQ